MFLHGFSDHIGRYEELFRYFTAQGIQVFAFDQRGWGRSVKTPSDRGVTGPTSQVLMDIASFIESKLSPDAPLFVFGHSMGGGEALTLASTPKYNPIVSKVHGWILEAPFLGFPPGEEPSTLKVIAGRAAARLFPRRTLMHRIVPEKLAHNLEVQKSLAEDTLCHDTGTLEGLAGLLDRTIALSSGKLRLLPSVKSLYLAHGTQDQATSYSWSKRWFDSNAEALADATFRTFDDCAHQLHADDCKYDFFKDVTDWILERVGEARPNAVEGSGCLTKESALEHSTEPMTEAEGSKLHPTARSDSKL